MTLATDGIRPFSGTTTGHSAMTQYEPASHWSRCWWRLGIVALAWPPGSRFGFVTRNAERQSDLPLAQLC